MNRRRPPSNIRRLINFAWLPAIALVVIIPVARLTAQDAKPATATESAPTASLEPKQISFNFSETPWEDVARWLADIGKKSLLVESKPAGNFSYFDKRTYSFTEALDVINSVLLTKGHILLVRNNFLILANLKEGIPPHLVERVDASQLGTRARTELVKVLLTLKGLVADEAKKEFETMSSPYGKILSLPSTNQLLIVDTAQNVQQVVSLIDELEGDQGKADLRAFPLKHVSVRDIERVVRDLLGLPPRESERSPTIAAVPAGSGRGDGERGERFRQMAAQFLASQGLGQPQPQQPQQGQPAAQRNTNGPFVSVDERTNTLFVSATPDKLALVGQVVSRLDTPQAENDLAEQTPRIEVYPVAAGDADGLAEVLQNVFQQTADLKVTAHPDGRSLIIYATPRDHERLKTVLTQIKSEGLRVEVIPLRTLDATTTAELIRALVGQKKGNEQTRFSFFDRMDEEQNKTGPWVEPDANRNRLVVRGTEAQIRDVRNLLIKLGEVGLAADGSLDAGPGRYRVVPLAGQDPRDIAQTVQRLWQRLDPRTPIRVEVLGSPPSPDDADPSPDDPSEPIKRDRRQPTPEPNKPQPEDSSNLHLPSQGANAPVQLVAWQEEAPPADEQPPKSDNPEAEPTSAPPVTIVVGPDNIALFSEDAKSLDMLENLLNTVVQGEQTSQFAYYYLKIADAQETAILIDQAIYGEERRQSFFFIEEEKPNRARILPDVRANAILVVGPVTEQRKVEKLLEVIDAEDRPDTGAVPKPRVIPLQAADATEVADIIRDVFAQQIFDSRNRQQQRINIPNISPFGFGGFGGGSRRQDQNRDNQQGKLTVGVDTQTNSLIVSAPLEIYREVEKLAKSLDESSAQAGRAARVVTLRNASPEAVEKALGNLFGVRTSEDLEAERAERARLQAEEEDDRAQQTGRRRNRQRDVEDLLRNINPGGGFPGGFRGGFSPF